MIDVQGYFLTDGHLPRDQVRGNQLLSSIILNTLTPNTFQFSGEVTAIPTFAQSRLPTVSLILRSRSPMHLSNAGFGDRKTLSGLVGTSGALSERIIDACLDRAPDETAKPSPARPSQCPNHQAL
ncbi:hypothetical protein [Rhodococcus sp. IEGM 1379]|uniref:hypothetical protein n=1 Tax=Rhodococcus sp. IEGM 1379 TaxID=3047086 RepID=UPI0024B81475|nr:hypothetical protein [Rhodococcus sp. IEGM 1379]MDI9918485.1 hypothetical protein [Rhodococcus sp. IEGM 1379]